MVLDETARKFERVLKWLAIVAVVVFIALVVAVIVKVVT